VFISAKLINAYMYKRKNNFEASYMAKMRFDPSTGNAEWEGTPQELLLIYESLKQRFGNTPRIENPTSPQRDPVPKHIPPYCDYAELAKKMPTIEQLMTYILSKPRFEHDILDVGVKFFGKPIKSRQYGKLYRELRTKLELVRKAIEVSQRGAFEQRPAPNRNLRIYTFKQVNATPLGLAPQKTS
jgi:hypothetical protein